MQKPGFYVPVTNLSNHKSEEDFILVEPTQEDNNEMFEESSDFPLQTSGSRGYENCPKNNGKSRNETSHACDQYNYDNQNRFPGNSDINEGEIHDRFYDVCYPLTLVEAVYDTPTASQQTYLSKESAVRECENKNDPEELLRRQGIKEPIEDRIKSVLTESINVSEYPAVNLLSPSSEVEDRYDIENTPSPFSSCPMAASNRLAQQIPQTSGKVSKRLCKECGKYFMKEWTFIAHKKNFCIKTRKPFKCGECGEIFRDTTSMLIHQSLHTGEKPFKCSQCDFASARSDHLKIHMRTHAEK